MFDEVWFNKQNVEHHLYKLSVQSNFQKITLDIFLMNLKALTFENLYKL